MAFRHKTHFANRQTVRSLRALSIFPLMLFVSANALCSRKVLPHAGFGVHNSRLYSIERRRSPYIYMHYSNIVIGHN